MVIKQKKLSWIISMNLIGAASAISSSAVAQDESLRQADEVEVIQVSGIRSSLVQSLMAKRAEASVTDGIAAEDIGKFPDQNVAESLQRITGVTISRDGGEGQNISIRGFGPQFNTVLLNQRTVPTDNGGRAFSFDMIASELINGADVYKSTRANMQEGSIGGTVNVKTTKPFDIQGFRAVASTKLVHDILSGGTTPNLSGLVSNNFGNFGVLASFAYQQRDVREDKAEVGGYRASSVTPGSEPFNSPKTDKAFFRPQTAAQSYTEQNKERIGGTIALQFAPSDDLVLTTDAVYSRLEVDDMTSTLSRYFSPPMFNAKIDTNGTVYAFDRVPKPEVEPGVYQLFSEGESIGIGQWNSSNLNSRDRDSQTLMIGANAQWFINNEIKLEVDLQNSSTSRRSLNNPAMTLANPTQAVNSFEMTGSTFKWSGSDEEFNGNKGSYMANNLMLFSDLADDDIVEGRADLTWDLDLGPLLKLKAGLYYSDREKAIQRYETPWNPVTTAFRGFYVNVPERLLHKVTADGGFLSEHSTGGFVNSWYTYKADDVIDYLMSHSVFDNAEHKGLQLLNNAENGGDAATDEDAQAATDTAIANMKEAQAVGFKPQLREDKSWLVSEETQAAYIEADFETELARVGISGNIGLRYINTETSSKGLGTKFVGLNYDTGAQSVVATTETGQTLNGKGSYSELLPSLNVKFDLTDDFVSRFAYSKSLTRPILSDLSPSVTIANTGLNVTGFDAETLQREFIGQISGDNPNLKPYISNNVDFALEWYFAPESYVGATVFYKEIEDWIVSSSRTVQLPDIMHDNMLLNFEQRSPFNNESADAKGIELSMLHNFDNGFGVQANYTYMDSSAKYNINKENLTFSLDGLSKDSYNLIGFYENESWQARVAYNWRSEYTECAACSRSNQPIMVEDYGQVDASISYEFNEQFTVTADVVNLTGEDPRKFSTYRSRFLSLADSGTRYSVGLRASF